MNQPGYESLAEVLQAAYDQAARGKGAERHANDLPFHEQPMQQIARRRGLGFLLGQADKKTEEAQGMLERGERDAWRREILGAIVYLAGALVFTREQAAAEPGWYDANTLPMPGMQYVAEIPSRAEPLTGTASAWAKWPFPVTRWRYVDGSSDTLGPVCPDSPGEWQLNTGKIPVGGLIEAEWHSGEIRRLSVASGNLLPVQVHRWRYVD